MVIVRRSTKMEKQTSVQKVTIFVAVITSFITSFTGSALNLSVPDIGAEFHVSAVLIGWVVTGFILSSSAFSVPFGRLADLTGRKRILVMGIGLFGIFSLAGGFAWSIESLLVFRVLQGFGTAMIFSTNIAMLVNAFPPQMRGKVLGLSTASTYIGLSMGPVLGGVLNHQFGWRSIFYVTFMLSLFVFFIAGKMLPKSERKAEIKKEDRDLAGNCLYVSMLILILYGFSSFSAGLHAKICILVGIILLIYFIYHELRVPSPVMEIKLFKENPSYFLSNLAALLNYAATFAIGYLLSIYLQVIQGFDSQTAGLILICQPVLMAIISPYAGKLSDRKSPYILASFGMGMSALGLFYFAFVQKDTPLWMIILGLMIVGIGFGFFSSPNTNAIMSCVDKKDSGVASSLLATMRTVGQTTSMALVTFIAAMELGNVTLEMAEPTAILDMMHIAFGVFGIICVIGIFISMKRKGKPIGKG